MLDYRYKMLNSRGFTLIELLVVISIIGILAGLTLVSFTGAQRQARDAQRQSDIKQYQALLETFAGPLGGVFPSRTTAIRPDIMCADPPADADSDPLSFANNCLRDPSSTTYEYYYISNGSGAPANNATQYVMWTYQENQAVYFVVCSNGKTGPRTVAPASSNCPI